MKTPMKSFHGSPLLNSNMLQTLFPTSIPLIRTNLALYLLYDFFLSSVFFPLTPLFRRRHFLATNIQITWCCFLLCLRHFHIILFSALFRLLSAFLLVRLLSVVGFRLAFCLCLFLRPCLFHLQVHHFFRLFFFPPLHPHLLPPLPLVSASPSSSFSFPPSLSSFPPSTSAFLPSPSPLFPSSIAS